MTILEIPERMTALDGEVSGEAMQRMIEMVLGARLVFAERLDPQVLARATRLLLDLEPVLGCWYEPVGKTAEWVRCESLDEQTPFEIVESTDPDAEVSHFHGSAFQARGPRIEVLLVRTSTRDEVCLKLDHIAGDGWSAKECAHLLAETYTRLLVDPDYEPVPRIGARPTYDAVWDSMSDEQRARVSTMPPPQPSKWRKRLPHSDAETFHARSVTFSAELVASVRQYAHSRGATVNEALLAAMLRSATRVGESKKQDRIGFSVSADTRRLVPDVNLARISMIATTMNVLMDYDEGEPFDRTLRRVVEGIKPHRECLWDLKQTRQKPSPVLMRTTFGFLAWTARHWHYVSVADMNVGRFDEARLAFGSIRPEVAVATGPAMRFPSFPALISSYREATTIWTGFREKCVAPGVIEAWLSGTKEELVALSRV